MAKNQASRHAETAQIEDSETLLAEVLLATKEPSERDEAESRRAITISGVAVGLLAGLEGKAPLVTFADNPAQVPIVARSTAVLGADDVGREVALLFEGGDPARPIIIGLMHEPDAGKPLAVHTRIDGVEASVDAERLLITADKAIVFRCGKASITLTRAGKVLIEGAYVLARSTGVTRILGGAVLIN